VRLWWPNGYGGQSLYDYRIHFETEDGSEKTEKIVSVGFRTLEVVEEYVNASNIDLG